MSSWETSLPVSSSATAPPQSNSNNYGGNHQKLNSTLPGPPPFIPGLSIPFGAHGPTTTVPAPAPVEYHPPPVQAPIYAPSPITAIGPHHPHHQLPPPHPHPHPHIAPLQPPYHPPYTNNHGGHVQSPPVGVIHPPPSQYPLRLPANSPISPSSHHPPLTPGGGHILPSVPVPHTPQVSLTSVSP